MSKTKNNRSAEKFKVEKRELLLDDIFYSLTNIINDAIIVADSRRKIVYWNRASEKIFNYSPGEVMGKSVSLVIPQDMLSFNGNSRSKNNKGFQEIIGKRKKGVKIFLEASVSRWESEKGLFYTLVLRDVSARKNNEDKLRYLSFHDNLTGLYNRSYFDEELRRLDTHRQLPLSIIIGDIDGFKVVNDAFGYNQGDELLKNLSKILRESCRSEDILARWGGDEFVILLPKTDLKGIQEIIGRIGRKSRELGSGEIPLNISLGFATKDNSSKSIESVVREAEDSMKKKKLIQSKKFSNIIITSIAKKLSEKSFYPEEISERIKKLAVSLGRAVKLSGQELENLSILADFHDIGKVAIKKSILIKKSKLADSEWQVMRMHPETGYRIAKSSTKLAQIADDILAHHEHWDGSGYPYHIKGLKIPVNSRIIAIAEAFDAMVKGRNHKKPVGTEIALKELKKNAKKQFDPHLVSKFIEIMQHQEENPSLFQ
jgi:diguanylate cyclase (GGDEF)-like protein/PAS domain S-box-containing protein